MFLFGQAQAQESVHVLKGAQAELEPEGMPTWFGEVKLPHLWDKAFPGHNGRGRYRLELPPVMADGTGKACGCQVRPPSSLRKK